LARCSSYGLAHKRQNVAHISYLVRLLQR